MERDGPEIHVTTEEARGGTRMNVVTWVLVISMALALIGMGIAWIMERRPG